MGSAFQDSRTDHRGRLAPGWVQPKLRTPASMGHGHERAVEDYETAIPIVVEVRVYQALL